MKNKSNTQPAIRFTTNHQIAVDFLRGFKPEWLEEMPMMITSRTPGKVSCLRREYYDSTTRSGAFVAYWGNSAYAPDNGWLVCHVIEATEAQFNVILDRLYLLQELIC